MAHAVVSILFEYLSLGIVFIDIGLVKGLLEDYQVTVPEKEKVRSDV